MRAQAIIASLLLPLLAQAGAPLRQEASLNGAWQRQFVPELGAPPTGGAWEPCTVPGYFEGVDGRRVWLRRSFDVPEAMRGLRIAIHFGGVKYNSRVFLNSRQVGGCFGGYEPFDADVTDAVRFGQPNELLVGCCDWTGVFAPGPFKLPEGRNWDAVRSAPRDLVLSPIGGLFNLFGIWDDVTLRAHPAVFVQDLFIKPSVRRHELVVDYVVANESNADADVGLYAEVKDKDGVPVTLPARIGDGSMFMIHSLRIPSGKTAKATLTTPWPNPRLWSHADPYLYGLQTDLLTHKEPIITNVVRPFTVADKLQTRFGFREFWTEGPDFYLNGVKIHLLATSWWPPHSPMKREEIEKQWKAIKAAGCVAFRTHTQPWPALHYDVADELGLLMIPEGAVWNDDDAYRVNDIAFWDNYAKHLHAMVDRDKNRPSVIMWSLENELTGGRVNDNTPFPKAQLMRMGKLVKEWDPTRPITYESDGDPGGVADVIGLHYPHEYPDYTCWPNEAFWMDKPIPGSGGGGIFLNGQKEFLWRRNKPLYIGEFLWVPSADPAPHTIFFGDEAYKDYHLYQMKAKAEAWKMAILAYRHYGVSGMCPWTVNEGGPLDATNPLYQAHQEMYQPIAAYCLDYDRSFFAGEQVARRVEVFNDSPRRVTTTLAWSLGAEDVQVGRGKQEVQLEPGEHREVPIVLPMPDARLSGDVDWALRLEGGGARFEQVRHYGVFQRRSLPTLAVRAGLFDPKGGTRRLLEAQGLRVEPVASLGQLGANLDLLVIGAKAFALAAKEPLAIGRIAPEREAITAFLERGGRVLVLEQDVYPEGLFNLSLTSHCSTMTYRARPGHPALRRLVYLDDLKFWRGDHLVTHNETPRPACGGAIPIVVSGSAAGLDHAPLLEIPVKRGCLVLSQLLLVGKFASEPAAARILGDLLEYLATYRSTRGRTAVLGGSPEYLAHLRSLGLEFDVPKDPPRAPSAHSLVVFRGGIGDPAKLREFVEQGGQALLHRLPPAALASLVPAFGVNLTLQPYSGHVTRAEGREPLLGAILREDLYWLGPHRGISWAETPRATDMADGVFGRSLDGLKPVAHAVEKWTLEGQIVERRAGNVIFATNGSASSEIEFPDGGTYVFGLLGSGTPCDGGYPVANISLDGQLLGSVYVDSPEPRVYTTFGEVPKGSHKVTVAFVNDASNPAKGEDRNLTVEKLLIARDEKPGDVAFLTNPPAVAVIRRGKGILVIDQLKWDTEEANARKAARYASSLLTALGGDFASRPSWAIECETMTPQPGMPWFHADATAAHLGCSGWIKGPIQVAAVGRYTMEIVASGSPAEKVYPHIDVALDGKKIGEVQLTTGGWRPYPLAVELPAGQHELLLAFTNDLNVGGEDRNLSLDKVVFYKE